MTKAKFPLAFRLFPQNLLNDKSGAWETAKQGDLLVQAVACPEDMPKCTAEDGGRMQAKGVAMAVMDEAEMEQRIPIHTGEVAVSAIVYVTYRIY